MSRLVPLTLPKLKEDLDLDAIDSKLFWLQGSREVQENPREHLEHICGVCGEKFQLSKGLKRHLAAHSNVNLDHWLQSFALPMTANEVINVPLETLIAKNNLTVEELKLIKDVRRRGKNRKAAIRSRQRKQAMMKYLEADLQVLREKRKALMQTQVLLLLEQTKVKSDILSLHNYILNQMGFDSTQWQLTVDCNGEVHVAMQKNYQFYLSKV